MIWILNLGVFRVFADVFEVIAWTINPVMKNAGKYYIEAFFYKPNIFEPDIPCIRLIVADNAVHQPINRSLNLRRWSDPIRDNLKTEAY